MGKQTTFKVLLPVCTQQAQFLLSHAFSFGHTIAYTILAGDRLDISRWK